jgi:hypothetical protein
MLAAFSCSPRQEAEAVIAAMRRLAQLDQNLESRSKPSAAAAGGKRPDVKSRFGSNRVVAP